jgi:predicted N-acyltransferase
MVKTIRGLFCTIPEGGCDSAITKSPSSLKISIFESINFVPEQEWNMVVPETKGLMRHPYLTAIENSAAGQRQSRYVLMYQGTTPVAAAIFHIIVLTGENYGTVKVTETALERLTNTFMGRAKMRVLVCGHTQISGDHGFIYTDAISPQQAYHALADACDKIRQAEKLSGKIDLQLIKDFYEGEFESSNLLSEFSYHRFKVDPNMILKIRPDWNAFDDYLQAMNTKYRKKALSVIRQGSTLERRSLTAPEIQSDAAKIHELYLKVANKARFRINHFDCSYLVQLKLNLGRNFEFIGYYSDGEMVAFSTVIFWGDKCEAHAIGINYELNNDLALYQNILYDFVKISLTRKTRELILGRTAMEMKSNIGAEPHDMWCYIRHSGPLMNHAFKPIVNYIKETEWIQRSPFKEQNLSI